MNLYISHNYRNLTSAGNKAKSDMEDIMALEGYRNIGLQRSYHSGKAANTLLNFFGIMKAAFSIHKGDTLVLQYPLKKYFSFLCRVAHLKGARTIALVHDLGSCRRKALTVEKELRRLGRADHVIATNTVMMRHLKKLGLKSSLSSLDLWDYLSEANPANSRVRDREMRVAYAGLLNRRKNAFLWSWGDVINGYSVDIYGQGFRMDQVAHPECFVDHGFVDSEQLISGITGDFGLVWDGDSLNSCKGDFGEYLALNTPHKLSLYLRARLPIIIWRGAALAHLVREMGVGITVNSLADISKAISAITPAEYIRMKGNVDVLCDKISKGFFFRRALKESIDILNKSGK
jgi:hypothetical protein